jgi:hypothetical protein
MEINRVTRKIRLDSKQTAIKYQLITELIFLRRQTLIDTDLVYLTLLVEWGPISLKEFCNKVVLYLFGETVLHEAEKYSVRVQTVRNRIGILEKRGLVQKSGKGIKTISFTSAIPIETKGNILLEYNFLYVETKESKATNSRVGQETASL